MNSAVGAATAQDAIHAPGQIFKAVQLMPTAITVESPATIEVMKKVSTTGTMMRA